MKIKSFILTAFAALAVFASCNKQAEPAGTPEISLDPTELTIAEAGSTETVALTATRAWKIDGQIPEWLTVTPVKGEASNAAQTITIEVKANEAGNRTANLKFTIGLFDATLKIAQAGPNGDKVDITPIADFIKNADPAKVCTLKGKVENVAKGDRFWGFDINDGTGVVTAAFPANWEEWKDKIADGGTVTVQGPYEFFEKKGTHQVKKCTIISFEAGEVVPPVEAEQISVADFIKKADTQTVYRLVGKVENVAKGDRFWGFDINDGTGVVTAAFPANWEEWKAKIENGGTVTVQGPYEFFEKKGTHQVKKCTIISFEMGGVTPDPEPEIPGETKTVTVAEFLAAPVSAAQWYQLTGTIKTIADETYGNIYLEDETGVVYCYGLTQTQVDKNDQSFAKIGLHAGDILTMNCKRGEFKGDAQAVNGYYVSHKPGEAKPEKPDGPATKPFTSEITWTVSADSKNDPAPSYNDEVTVNGGADKYPALKLGTSSKFGKATLNIPAGTKKIGFYAAAWKGTGVSLKFGNGAVVDGVRANLGATGGKPYKLVDLTALDYYEIALKGDEGTLTIETAALGKRAIIFGINPVK